MSRLAMLVLSKYGGREEEAAASAEEEEEEEDTVGSEGDIE